MMKVLSFLLFCLSFACYAQNHAEVEQRITDAFNRRYSDDLLIGSSVGYIDEQGQVELSLGMVESVHQKFEIGSISKSFTGIVLAQLVVENKVALTTLLEEVVPELKNSFVGQQSLKRFANHAARLVRNHPKGDNVSEQEIIDFLKTYNPGPSAPTEGQILYSNLGFATLGLAISRITSKSYADTVRERIFLPLGMNESDFLTSADEHKNLITPHNILLQPTVYDVMSDLVCASGGITSSLHDMMKFLKYNYTADEAVLLAHKEELGFNRNSTNGRVWKNGGMTGYSSLMYIDPVNHNASIVLSNSINISSTERLALIATGAKDTFVPDSKLTPEFVSSVVGKYYNDEHKLFVNVVATKQGYLGFIFNSSNNTSNTRGTRLVSEDKKTFFFLGNGWGAKDYLEFKTNSETGLREVLIHEPQENDENGSPVSFENVFTEVSGKSG